jgi:integrase
LQDQRLLKQRRKGWHFCIPVPRDLQGTGQFMTSAGKPLKTITRGLKTDSLAVAQKARLALEMSWKETFERARSGQPLSLSEIDAQARECFASTLERMEADAARGRPWSLATPDNEGDDPEVAGLSLAFDLLAEASEAGDFSMISDDLAAAQRRARVTVEPGTKAYRLLGDALISAKMAAVHGRMHALQGQVSEEPATFVIGGIDRVSLQPLARIVRPKIPKGQGGMTLSQAAAGYVAELQRDEGASLTEQTRGQHELAFRLFGQYVKDASLSAIDRGLASKFIDAIATLDPNWGRSPQTKTLSVWELLEKFGGKGEQLSNKTLNRYVSSLSSLYKWARKRGHFDGANPFSEQSRAKARKGTTGWLPYNDDELNALFGSPLFRDAGEARIKPKQHSAETALLWVPLIALFSGMRLGEVCQLRTADVRREGDVWVFNITEEGEGQSVKTFAGIRQAPVHSVLIGAGLLDYLRALPEGQLFPGLTPGGPDKKLSWYFSKRFTDYRRSVGVDRARLSFHSFRKNVSTALDNAGVPQADVAALIGHERGFTFDTYSKGLATARLQGIVEKINYPGLTLNHLQSKRSF